MENNGKMPRHAPYKSFGGLCEQSQTGEIDQDILIDYFQPTPDERKELSLEGKSYIYWADGMIDVENAYNRGHVMTELRQNIVLLMAAIAGEL